MIVCNCGIERTAMAAIVSALTFRSPGLASSVARTRQPGVQMRTNVSFPGVSTVSFRQAGGMRVARHVCQAEGDGDSCCEESGSTGSTSGGNGEKCGNHRNPSGGNGGKCSSHRSVDSDISGIGKEFETLVAQKTMLEFEKNYVTGEMQGSISRDVITDVVNSFPEALATQSEEKFLSIDELLAEARALSSGDLIFDADFEDMLV